MTIIDYLSHVFQSKDQESSHQYITQYPREYYLEQPISLEVELWRFYHLQVFKAKQFSDMSAFLDYHLFKFNGSYSDFVFFVRMSPEWIPMEAAMPIYNIKFRAELTLVLVDWLEQKKRLHERNPYLIEQRDYKIKPMRDGKPVANVEIERFFVTRLCQPKRRGGRPIVGEGQVKQWVHACFHGSELQVENVKIKVNGTQKDILAAVYEFFDKVDTDTSVTYDYCYMLIDTFDKFSKYIDPVTGSFRVEKLQSNFPRHGLKTKRFS